MAADSGFWKQKQLFELTSMRSAWQLPTLYVRDPVRTTKGDFHNFAVGTFAFLQEVNDGELGEIIERSGEILPAILDGTGEACYLFNCTVSYNCLDRANTEMLMTPDETMAIEVMKYAFHPDRIGDCNLFKIPETRRVGIYALVGRDDPEDEFYTQYHTLGFTGLKFEEVWSDEESQQK